MDENLSYPSAASLVRRMAAGVMVALTVSLLIWALTSPHGDRNWCC